MTTFTRGEFLSAALGASGALALGSTESGAAMPGAPAADTGAGGDAPDLLLLNARVLTMDGARPRAEAFAVQDGRFSAVGTMTDLAHLKGPGTQVIDARGRTVVPGFIDAHSHPAWGGSVEVSSLNVDLPSLAAIKNAIREKASRTPPGEWIVASKYDDTKVSEGRRLTREDLDEAAPAHPVRVMHRGGHTSWYNTPAFALAGITAATPDPAGGRYQRRDGALDGFVAGRANEPFAKLMPPGPGREELQRGIAVMSRLMTAAGLTSVTDAETSDRYLTAYQDAHRAGEMRFRVYAMPQGYSPIYTHLRDAGLYTGFGDDWLKLGAVKWVADGSAQERTMRMSTPFADRPTDYGILYMEQDAIDAAVEDAHRHRFQIGIHANGDVTIDMVLKAYERAQRLFPRPDPRFRIEHCSLVNEDLLRRIKAIGAIPTPFYTYVHYHGTNWVAYGPEKMRSMFAHRSFLDHGIPVAPASDYIPGPFEPLMALQSLVTRKDFAGRVWGENQRITLDEALRLCTMGGAYASYEEGLKGSITRGKLADFVMLEKDPHDVEPDAIKTIPVVRTVVGGRTVHSLE
jgi:predicted amidohydrolase YtcJ